VLQEQIREQGTFYFFWTTAGILPDSRLKTGHIIQYAAACRLKGSRLDILNSGAGQDYFHFSLE
jgi:hypothetical protein